MTQAHVVRVMPATRACNKRERFFNVYTVNKTLNIVVGLDTRYFIFNSNIFEDRAISRREKGGLKSPCYK